MSDHPCEKFLKKAKGLKESVEEILRCDSLSLRI